MISNGPNTRRSRSAAPEGRSSRSVSCAVPMRPVDPECRRGRPPEALVQPQHDAVAALGPLHRLDDHAGVIDSRQAVERRAVGDPQRVVEPVALPHDLGEIAALERAERVGEAVDAAIGRLVGERRGAQQVEAQQAALGPVPVLAVVEQCESAAGVLGGDPLVRADLELGLLDGVALGGDALDVSELDLAPHGLAVVRGPELGTQHPVLLVPVDLGLESHDVAAGLEHDALVDRDAASARGLPAHGQRAVDRGLDVRHPERPRRLVDVVGLDVPGVERPDVRVLVHDEPVEAAGGVLGAVAVQARDDLAAVGVERQGEDAVAQRVIRGDELRLVAPAGRQRRRRVRSDLRAEPAGVRLHELAPGQAREVHRRRRPFLARQTADELVGVGVECPLDALVGLDRLAVDARDRRAGEDVVELVQQHVAPVLLEHGPAVVAHEHREGLDLVQLALDEAVVALDLPLRRVRALVGLEVELADVGVGDLALLERPEEVACRGVLHPRKAAEVLLAPRDLVVDLVRTAAAVAGAVDEERRVQCDLGVLLQAGEQVVGRPATVVVAFGRHVHEHGGSVDPLPVEAAVREVVDRVPRELDGLEPVHAGAPEDLRQVAVVAEGVGQPAEPQLVVGEPELLLEEPAADERLPHERLPRRQVRVGLHPERALQLHAAVGDGTPHPLEEGRMPLLHPRHLLRLGGAVDVVVAPVDRVEGADVGARGLAAGLAERPQPGHVEVAVPDGAVDELARRRRRQLFGERRSRAGEVARREAGVRVAQRSPQFGLERGILGRPGQHEQGEVVVVERVGLVVAGREMRAVVDRAADLVEDPAVVGDVGEELDRARRRVDVAYRPVLPPALREIALLEDGAHRVEEFPVGRVHEALAADAEHHDGVLDPGRHVARDAQPGAVEHLAPVGAGPQRTEGRAVEVVERDRLGRTDDLGVEPRDGRVHPARMRMSRRYSRGCCTGRPKSHDANPAIRALSA